MATNKLILGDCLNVLQSIHDKSVGLIFADTLFFKERKNEVIWGDEGEIRSFGNRWAGEIDHYTGWLIKMALKDRTKKINKSLCN
ncbi:MAG: hypothetical protein LBJ17_05115 [Dysgonamonadaceae bacterium]|jgi:DNA modification methylase|nr:hypothetical protein [Dysgonamonadaceae bacterium]